MTHYQLPMFSVFGGHLLLWIKKDDVTDNANIILFPTLHFGIMHLAPSNFIFSLHRNLKMKFTKADVTQRVDKNKCT